MSRIFETLHWIALLPEGWDGSEENAVVTFVSSNGGIGALQVSTFVNDHKLVTPQSLFECAQTEQPTGALVHLCEVGNMPAAELIYDRDDRSWRKVWMGGNHTLLYITYNCKRGEERIEREKVDQLLSTLRLRIR